MVEFFIILYLVITVLIGLYSSRFIRNSADFIIAGRRLPLFMASSALFATWFGSETILGASSEFAQHGLMGVMEDPFGASLCLILVGAFFAKPLYKMNIRSFGDFYRIKYGKKVELIASICIVLSYLGWIAAQMVALGVLLEAIMSIPMNTGMLIGAIIVCLYTWFGGLWAVAITDSIQTVIIVGGLIFIAAQMTGKIPDLTNKINELPNDFFRFYPTSFNEGITYFAAWITIGLGSIPQQDIFQRVIASKSVKVAVRSSYLSGLMYLTVGLIPLYIGMLTIIQYPEMEVNQQLIPQSVLVHGNVFIQILFSGAIISAILSTSSGAILAPATVLEENILNRFVLKPNDKNRLRIVRYSILAITLISLLMAFHKGNIYDLVASSSALSLVSLFVPLVGGLYLKKKSELSALLSIVFGMTTWLVFEYVYIIDFPAIISGLFASVLGWILGIYFSGRRNHFNILS